MGEIQPLPLSANDVPIVPTGQYKIGSKAYPSAKTAEDAVKTLLQWVGEDPDRDGLKETPYRVIKALHEMTSGYRERPEEILSKVFEEECTDMIVVRNISFTSICEHHVLPFTGSVDVGYIPGKVVGLSKIARLVDCFSRRLQIQERMTKQIATSIQQYLEAKGVAVVVKASHSCMSCRGVRKPEAEMITSCMLGVFLTEHSARMEFLSLTS